MEEPYKSCSYLERQNAFKVFRSTGEIQDPLLVFFDQDGKWTNDPHPPTISWNSTLPKQIIPKERLVRTCENGRKILLSSFRSLSKKPIKLDYHHVMGNIEVWWTLGFHAPNLITVDGRMLIESARVIHVPCLEQIKSYILASSVRIFDVPNLETIEGYLVAGSADVFHAPKLERVGSRVEAHTSAIFHAPRLRTAGRMDLMATANLCVPDLETVQDLLADSVTIFDAPKLVTVSGELKAQRATIFHAPNLRTVGSDLDAGSAVNFEALKLETVGRSLILRPETLHAAVRAGCKAAIAKAAGEI